MGLNKQISEMSDKMEEQRKFINDQRCDYLRELNNLRGTLNYFSQTSDQAAIRKKKPVIKVQFFDELKGVDKQIVELLNTRLSIQAKEADYEINKRAVLIDELVEKINKYKALSPESFSLLDMPLKKIIEALAIIEPRAYPLWSMLKECYPPDHFLPIMMEQVSQNGLLDPETYAKLIAMVDKSAEEGLEKIDATIEEIQNKYETKKTELRE